MTIFGRYSISVSRSRHISQHLRVHTPIRWAVNGYWRSWEWRGFRVGFERLSDQARGVGEFATRVR